MGVVQQQRRSKHSRERRLGSLGVKMLSANYPVRRFKGGEGGKRQKAERTNKKLFVLSTTFIDHNQQ